MSYLCEYCNRNFKTKGVLKTHQETAKYCLNLREKVQEEITTNNECEYCKKNLTTKFKLELHKKICRSQDLYKRYLQLENNFHHYKISSEEKYRVYEDQLKYKDLEISKLEENISNLQNQIKELASLAIEKPSNNIINTSNNNSHNKMIDNRTLNMVPFNLTQEQILETLKEKFEEKHLMKGQEGLASFFVENILVTPEKKFLYRCTDPSRNHFIFVDEDGNVQKDINGYHLTNLINGPVKQRTIEIYRECQDKYFDNNVNNENNDGADNTDEDRLIYITDKVTEITNLKNNNTKFLKGLAPPLIVKK